MLNVSLDALGNPIELGKTYGYTSTKGSWTGIVLGKAIKFTEKGVTLEVLSRRIFLYGEPYKPDGWRKPLKKANTSSHNLFPVKL